MAKPNKKHRKITAAVHMSEDDLRTALEDILDSDICQEIVDIGYSEHSYFDEERFWDLGEFCEVFLNSEDALEVAKEFWDGDDLDETEEHANPYADYARYYNGVQTTDYPGDVYLNEISDEIIDYIIDNIDYGDYPSEVQDLIDDYNDLNSKDLNDEDYIDEEDEDENNSEE